MSVEGGFIFPLGVEEESLRLADGFEEMDRDAGGLSAGGREDAMQLVEQLLLTARSRFKADKDVK